MNPSPDETEQLMQAMGAVYVKIPDVQLAIASGVMPPEKQKTFGELLVQLGNLLQEHAAKRVALDNLIIRLGEDPDV